MPSMKTHIKPKIPNKDELEDLAKKYGVRYILDNPSVTLSTLYFD